MRESSRLLLNKAVRIVVDHCHSLANSMLQPGMGQAAVLGMAWSIAQDAATELRERLEKSSEGREFIERAQRTAAGKRPS